MRNDVDMNRIYTTMDATQMVTHQIGRYNFYKQLVNQSMGFPLFPSVVDTTIILGGSSSTAISRPNPTICEGINHNSSENSFQNLHRNGQSVNIGVSHLFKTILLNILARLERKTQSFVRAALIIPQGVTF